MEKLTRINEALYNKLSAELKAYEGWLLSQTPEEILRHAYEYAVKQDIVFAVSENDFEIFQCEALLASQNPLSDVYDTYERKGTTDYMDEIQNSIKNCAKNMIAQRRKGVNSTMKLKAEIYHNMRAEQEEYKTKCMSALFGRDDYKRREELLLAFQGVVLEDEDYKALSKLNKPLTGLEMLIPTSTFESIDWNDTQSVQKLFYDAITLLSFRQSFKSASEYDFDKAVELIKKAKHLEIIPSVGDDYVAIPTILSDGTIPWLEYTIEDAARRILEDGNCYSLENEIRETEKTIPLVQQAAGKLFPYTGKRHILVKQTMDDGDVCDFPMTIQEAAAYLSRPKNKDKKEEMIRYLSLHG